MPPRPRPDPQRLGGIGWLEATRGKLTPAERRRLALRIFQGQLGGIASRARCTLGRRPDTGAPFPEPPDSALAREAEQACATQPATIIAHSYRTWAYGRMLARIDDVDDLDDELFYVASLLHDAGLVEAVTGQDFTLRSAEAVAECIGEHRDAAAVDRARDAVAAHCTPGASVTTDGPEATYVQAGATLDLGGLRLDALPVDAVGRVLAEYSRSGLVAEITPMIRAEAEAVPGGRFALLVRTGFLPAIRFAPFDQR